jgi:hypothetical protein
MSDELYAEYNAAIGSVTIARRLYADACEHQGPESWAAEQAQEYLTREVEHRDRVRAQYDAASRTRPPGERDG